MIAGHRSSRRRLPIMLLAIVAFVVSHGADADPPAPVWGLPQLMAAMQAVHAATAHFVEWKFVHVLSRPLQSSGTLDFVAPDRLQKRTLTPVPGRLTVEGDRLTVQQPVGSARALSLSEVPEIGALVAGIRATLAGDAATLLRYYTATVSGSVRDWSLLLEPRDNRLRDLLTLIRIQGSGVTIRSIETLERDGDRTEMTITPDAG
jgi:Outer membrane lipoprotein carrier protein LolA-like